MPIGRKTCHRCGEPLPTGALAGNCPRCLAVLALSSTTGAGANPPEIAARPKPQRFFGDYEILGELARGGMGIVYRARHVSLNRPVALKMIAAGQLATATQVQRFRLEAAAAARLDHPNIVPIYEVGEHQEQHFYSMKLIEGGTLAGAVVPPTAPACDEPSADHLQSSATPADRNRWTGQRSSSAGFQFWNDTPRDAAIVVATIARAVQYAHERGVLHRDLKPTNILIDREGRPHVTDFGVAKFFDDDAGLTQSSAVVGTPAYMAPELAAGQARAATTATDVYGLGTILYELLAGRPPFTAENVPQLLRKIVEEEVSLEPIRRRGAAPAAGAWRGRRTSSPEFVSARDLEIICRKCLEKDPLNRYSSAAALADDLDRWLNDEPIQARPATGAERIRRWCRRKPALAGLSAALTVAVLGGLVATSLLLWRERQASRSALAAEQTQRQLRAQAEAERESARTEAAKSLHLAQFLQEMLYRVGPSALLGHDTTMLREILDQTAGRIDIELTNQPAVTAELRDTVGQTFYELGDYTKAVAMHREAVRLRLLLQGNEDAATMQSKHLLAQALAAHGDLDEAEALDHETVAFRKKVFGSEHVKVADSLNNLGTVYYRRGDFVKAQPIFEQALAIYRRLDNPRAAAVLNNLANMLVFKPDYAGAEKIYRDAVAIARRIYGDSHPVTALYLRNLAESLRGQDRLAEADAIHSEALAVRVGVLDELHPMLADSFERLAVTKFQEQLWAEAATLYQKALAARRKQSPDNPRRWDEHVNSLADALNEQQKFDETERVLTDLIDALPRPVDPRATRLFAIRGSSRARHGQWRDALPDLARAVELDPTSEWNTYLLAPLLVESGNQAAFRSFCRECLVHFEATTNLGVAIRIALSCLLAPADEAELGTANQLLDGVLASPGYSKTVYAIPPKALAEYRSGRPAAAIARLEELLTNLMSGRWQAGRFVHIEARAILAMAHQALGHRDEARIALASALNHAPAKIATPSNGDYGGTWHEYLILQILLREARALIGESATPAREDPTTKIENPQ